MRLVLLLFMAVSLPAVSAPEIDKNGELNVLIISDCNKPVALILRLPSGKRAVRYNTKNKSKIVPFLKLHDEILTRYKNKAGSVSVSIADTNQIPGYQCPTSAKLERFERAKPLAMVGPIIVRKPAEEGCV